VNPSFVIVRQDSIRTLCGKMWEDRDRTRTGRFCAWEKYEGAYLIDSIRSSET